MGKIEINHTGSGGGVVLSSDGTDLLLGGSAIGGGASALTIEAKTSAYTVVAADLGKVINCTANTFTVSLTAASTLGAGFNVVIWNTSDTTSHAITIDPNSSETIDGLATLILRRGEGMQVVCDGSNFQTGDKKTMRGYADNIISTEARPVASGNRSISLGPFSTSTQAESFSAGYYARGTGAYSVAIGGRPTASSTGAIAIGFEASGTSVMATAIGGNSNSQGAKASGSGSVALGGSYASGADGFAVAVKNNTSSYGATGSGSIAMGYQAKATTGNSIAIGSETVASGFDNSICIGWQSTATSGRSAAVIGGRANNSSGDYSVVLGGQNNTASGDHSVAMGDTSTASHDNSVSIGDSVQSTAVNQINLGGTADTVRISETYTLPTADGSANQVLTTNGSGVVSFAAAGGADLYAANEDSPQAQPSATGSNAIAIGNSAIATASGSVAIDKSRCDGISSIAASINHTSTSYGAIGNTSVALGQYVKAGSSGIAIGSAFATTEGSQSVAIGRNVTSVGVGSLAMGHNSKANIIGQFAYTYGQFAAQGDSQSGQYVLKSDTTDATAEAMTTNNSTAGSTNQIVAASDTCITFSGTIVAMQNGAQAYGSWKIEGLLVNDGGTTTVPTSAITVINNSSSWGLALSADNTNNALAVTVTGEASHNIRWVANVQTAEVTYA